VEGIKSIPASAIVNSSGLVGTHIFAADPRAAAARIGQLPGIVSATVTLEWPNTAKVSVVEDLPIAIWEQAGDKYWINESGQMLPARDNATSLLTIRSEVEEPVSESGFIPKDVLQGAISLRDLRPNINLLYYGPGNGLSYQDGRGWRAFFGSGLDMEQKLVVYEIIVEDLVSRAVTPAYISVRNQAKPYYKTATTQ
jgi:hypothetical protein